MPYPQNPKQKQKIKNSVTEVLTDVGVAAAHAQYPYFPVGVLFGLLHLGRLPLLAADIYDLDGELLTGGLLHHPAHRTADPPVTRTNTHT